MYEYAITAHYNGWSAASGFTNAVSLPPDAPISVMLANGGGQNNAYVDNVNASHCTIRVSLDSTSPRRCPSRTCSAWTTPSP